MNIASAAAVPSSSSDAFAISSPVRSITIVWKFNSASSRPCEISGWYGVYAVYQPGFSSTFRLITAGGVGGEEARAERAGVSRFGGGRRRGLRRAPPPPRGARGGGGRAPSPPEGAGTT